MKTTQYYFGTGRRKNAIAQVRVTTGTGKIFNAKKENEKLSDAELQEITEPLKILSLEKKFDVSYIVSGGGVKSQAEAIRLGIARAISKTDEELEKTLKKSNLLTRDPREKERKKPGLKKARRAPQWAKR